MATALAVGMTRPVILVGTLIGSLLATSTASAERRRSRDRDRDDDRRADVDDEPRRGAKRSLVSRGRDRDRDDDDRIRSREERRRERVADLEDAEDSDGPEARAIVAVSLDDLIEVAVRHAPQLARAKLERESARGEAGAARRDQAWVVKADAQYSINAIGGDVEVELLTEVKKDELRGSVGLGRKLPSGGSISLEAGFTRTAREYAITKEWLDKINGAAEGTTKTDITGEFVTSHQAYTSVTLKQPLLRGFGPDVALAQERKADYAASEATIKAQLAAEEMVLAVVGGYWELAYAAYEVDVRNEALQLALRQERVTREEIRAGSAPQTALNAVTYEIAQREEAKLRAQTEYEKKSLEVRRKAGLELRRRELVIRPAEAFDIGEEEWDVDDVLDRSRKANKRLVALGLARRAADVDVTVAKNGMLPQVDVSVSGGLLGTGDTSNGAFQGVTAADGFQVMAGLTIQFEVSGAAKSAHDAAIARKSKIEVDRLDVQRTIDTEVVAAVHAVTSARARVGLADKAIAVAEDNVKAEHAQFQAQRSDNFRVMQRQSELIDARLRRGRAVADYHVAVAQLQALSGMILDQYRVNVRPQERK